MEVYLDDSFFGSRLSVLPFFNNDGRLLSTPIEKTNTILIPPFLMVSNQNPPPSYPMQKLSSFDFTFREAKYLRLDLVYGDSDHVRLFPLFSEVDCCSNGSQIE